MVVWENMWNKDGGLKQGEYFDGSRSSKVFMSVLQKLTPAPGATALVPGCGRGYDVIEMAKVGYNGMGLDIAPTAVESANRHNEACLKEAGVASWAGTVTFSTEDFFSLKPPGEGFDVIYDYTFLCALDPSQRVQWAETMKKLLKANGELITLIFPLGDFAGGPPHAMNKELVTSLLTAQGFEAFYLEAADPSLSHAGRGGKEMLGRWRLTK